MNNLEQIHTKNKFMVKLLWLSFMIALVMTATAKGGLQTTLVLIAAGGGIFGLLTILVAKKLLISQTMYITAIGMGIISFLIMFSDTMFPNIQLIGFYSLIGFDILITCMLTLQARFSMKLYTQLADKNDIEAANKRLESLIGKVKSASDTLYGFNKSLKENITITEKISNEVAASYIEISKGIESQSQSANTINESVILMDNHINEGTR